MKYTLNVVFAGNDSNFTTNAMFAKKNLIEISICHTSIAMFTLKNSS